MTVLHLAQIRLFVLLSLLSHLRFWQPPFPTHAYERQPRGPGSAVRNRTSGNAQLDAARLDTTRRRDFKEDDATVPVALGIWVYSAVARCFAWTRVVQFVFDSTRRAALRTKLSSICPKAAWIGHRTRPGVS